MSIQVYERFDSERGDLWETITWDFMAPTTRTPLTWRLRCDWRMPAHGVLRFMHPTRDEALEFSYDTPSIFIPDHTVGAVKQSSFTPQLKSEWLALPEEWTCEIGKMTLTCRKDIIDVVESTIFGELYIYRATELRVA